MTGRLLISDSEVDEMPPYFTGKNIYDATTSGTLVSTCSTTNINRTGWSNEPTGMAINSNNTGRSSEYVTAMLKGNATSYAIKDGNAQTGGLKTDYNGSLPTQSGYNPMHKEGAIILFDGLDEKIVQLGAAPGRDSLFETEDNVRMRLRAYLRGVKLIQILAISEPDLIDGPDAKRFFNSLKWE